jgi:gamma-glutamylcyclotransferase (GGCT)/AIG2-like uncharacterized protein YtfP
MAATVWGIVWVLTRPDEHALDCFEGTATGLYVRSTVGVQIPDGERIQALVYLASNASCGTARPGYLEGIIAAASERGLPPRYILELRTWLTIGA